MIGARLSAAALLALAAACAQADAPPEDDAPPGDEVEDDDKTVPPDAARWLDWTPRTDDGERAPRDPEDVVVDLDADGLDDAFEEHVARAYLPFLALHEDDECPLGGLVVRVRPHPADGKFVFILYDHLFSQDCGLTNHVGDNEVFGATIDPSKPAPEGIRALKAISHQSAFPCERTTVCGACDGLAACETAERDGAQFPVVFSSKNKHATYVERGACGLGSCLDVCGDPGTADVPPIVNAGEPDFPLIGDLTSEGFIQTEDGWDEALLHVDPWDPAPDFGSAGNVAGDLLDDAFLPPVCE